MHFRQIVPVINQFIWVAKSSLKNGILVSVTEAELSEALLFQAKPWSTGLSSPSELALTLGSHEGFPGGSDGKESVCNARDPGSIPGSGRSPGERQPTPVFLPGESHGQRRLMSYDPWSRRESDTTERQTLSFPVRQEGGYFKLLSSLLIYPIQSSESK